MAIHSVRRAHVEPGDTVAVFGAGTVGLLVAAMARLSGASTVLITDLDKGRVNYAITHGFATKGYHVTIPEVLGGGSETFAVAKDLGQDVVELACAGEPDLEGVDITFDCTGKEICMQVGLNVSPHLRPYAVMKDANSSDRQRDRVVS